MSKLNPFKGFQSSPAIIPMAVMVYIRFPLSLRNVDDLLHERGIDVSHETIRFWWHRFGPIFAAEIRRISDRIWRARRVIFRCMLAAPPLALSGAHAGEACHVAVGKLRYDDDIACFRDPANRDGLLGAIKFISFDDAGRMFLSLGGGVRQRYEYTQDPLFGAGPQDEAGVWLQRYTIHGDLHLGPHLRIFGELSSGLETGREGGPSPVDENRLALQNGLVDLSVAPTDASDLTLRIGRQELRYGASRLIDARDGQNVRRTFDAARTILEVPDWRIDGFAGSPRATRPGVFDDAWNDDQILWGVYATGASERLPAGALDLYYLGFHDDAAAYVQGTAEEERHTVGARFWGAIGAWDWDWEAVYQFGSFGRGDIAAWFVASDTGFRLADVPWRPRVALSANIASGDADPSDPDLGTFNPLFPRGDLFSEAPILGPRNFFNFRPFLIIHPTDRWSLTTDVNFFWRMRTKDGVYSPGGQIVRAPNGSGERFVGSAISMKSSYEIVEDLAFTAKYTHFFAGDFIRATGPANDTDFVELTLEWWF